MSTTGLVASAPGKVLLAGEYAVLERGVEAVLVAVDRRAYARVTDAAQSHRGFVAAAMDQVVERCGADSPAARAGARVVADTKELSAPDGTKLGLGSSAAVTVATIAAALATDGGKAERPTVHALAHKAHGRAQAARGARGSGADVAACVHGGLLAAWRAGSDRDQPLETRRLALPAGLELVFVWMGIAADTVRLIRHVKSYREAQRGGYRRAVARIADSARALARSLDPPLGDPAAAVTAVAAGGEALEHLARECGAGLVLPSHRHLRLLAERLGGAFKPTGAGAGDIGVAAFDRADAALSFREDVRAAGINLPALRVDSDGVRIE